MSGMGTSECCQRSLSSTLKGKHIQGGRRIKKEGTWVLLRERAGKERVTKDAWTHSKHSIGYVVAISI